MYGFLRNTLHRWYQHNTRTLHTMVIAIIYYVLFSTDIAWGGFSRLAEEGLYPSILALYTIWSLFFCLSFNRVVAFLGISFLFITGSIASYFSSLYRVTINETVVPVIFETNLTEIKGLVEGKLILWCLGAFILSLLMFRLVTVTNHKKEYHKLLFVAFIITVGSLLTGNNYTSNVAPYNYLYASAKYFINRYNVATTLKYDVAAPSAAFSNLHNRNLTVVFVIGESARADHFGINGYERDTTPLLKGTPNLVNFPYATSCEVLTRYSVPCMLTRAASSNLSLANKETSFLTIFRKLGFHTVWINGQSSAVNFFMDKGITDISQLQTNRYISSSPNQQDGSLLPLIQTELGEHPQKLLLVIHTRGSHWAYQNNYPDSFRKWQPICKQNNGSSTSQIAAIHACDPKALVNDYDNTILYTDFFLHSLVTLLRDRNALLVYSSDHGESLGENGRYLHGQDADRHIKEQRSVPMIWWGSEDYIQHNRERYNKLTNNRGRPVSHDNIFHSIIDCAGIETVVTDKKLSLCR